MAFQPQNEALEQCLDGPRLPVLVVGDVMVDRYLHGTVERVSPEAPVPIVRAGRTRSAAGGAGNVALGVAALGAEARLVGVVGDDVPGRRLRAALGRRGIDDGGLVTAADRPTTTKLRVVAGGQQVLRIDREVDHPVEGDARDRLLDRALERLDGAGAVILQDYDKGVLREDTNAALIGEARAAGIPVIVDPKLRHFFAFEGADVFKPNAAEAASALGRERSPADADSLRALAGKVGCRNLLVTLGAEGMALLEEGEADLLRIPSRAREVYDVSGAGDTVTATLGVALARGARLRDAAWLANVAAGLAVARFGARPISRRALREAIVARA